VGVPTSPQCGEEGLGNELGSGRCDWSGVARGAWVGGATAVAAALRGWAGGLPVLAVVSCWVHVARAKWSRAMRRGRPAIAG
jgi:hypothetical protein